MVSWHFYGAFLPPSLSVYKSRLDLARLAEKPVELLSYSFDGTAKKRFPKVLIPSSAVFFLLPNELHFNGVPSEEKKN